jgi:hypothetical protein
MEITAINRRVGTLTFLYTVFFGLALALLLLDSLNALVEVMLSGGALSRVPAFYS